jgi:peptidoglycan/xylan/chitin deacetylase (PgdA/CDA1 family)
MIFSGAGDVGSTVEEAQDVVSIAVTAVAPAPRSGGTQRRLAVAVTSGLLVATAAAFAITERLKLTPSPIAGTRVTKTFSPVCRCSTNSAIVRFRLRHGGTIVVDVIDANGAFVHELAHRHFRAGWLSFQWSGRGRSGRMSDDGTYRVRVHLPSDHRTIVFPNTIELDAVAPKIEEFRVTRHTIEVGVRTRVEYRFRGRAHPIVLVDGREAVYGRFAHSSGTVDWFGKVDDLPVRPGAHRLVLEARDDAGNTSTPTDAIGVRVKTRRRLRAKPVGHHHVAPQNFQRRRTAAVPILMYHVIASPFPTSRFPGLYVPPAEFAAQMQALASAGYHAVTLDQLRDGLRGTGSLPPRPIVISFDNGYRSQYTRALPVLRRLHWIGDENLQLSGLPPRQGGLGSIQIRGMVEAGWELDTQGLSHVDLTALGATALHRQVAVRSMMRRLYGVEPTWFCYPSGRYDPTVVAAVKAAGYVGATTVSPGWARRSDDPYRLPRLRVLGGTDPNALLELIADARNEPPPPPTYPPHV